MKNRLAALFIIMMALVLTLSMGSFAWANNDDDGSVVLTKLGTPANLTLDGTLLTWDSVQNADYYSISVRLNHKDDKNTTYTVSGSRLNAPQTEYDIESDIRNAMSGFGFTDSNDYEIEATVQACTSDNNHFANGDSVSIRKLISETGITIQTIKLGTPANLTLNGTLLTWDSVQNADYYSISVSLNHKDDTYAAHTVSGSSLNATQTEYDIENDLRNAMSTFGFTDSNDYELKATVRAHTNDNDHFANGDKASITAPVSETGITIQTIKLGTPANLTLDGTLLTWDSVQNTDYYSISVRLNRKDDIYTTYSVSGSRLNAPQTEYDLEKDIRNAMSTFGFTDSNDYEVEATVQACTNDNNHFANGDKAIYPRSAFVLSHHWDDHYTTDVPATCTADGTQSYHCKGCNAIKAGSSTVIPATGHSYGSWKTTRESTYTEAGSREKVCAKCGDKIRESIPKLKRTGWHKIGGEWYYFKSNGQMEANAWVKDSKGWCWMDASGRITKNKWIKSGGEWYYLKSNGYMAANEWAKDSGGWYWMNGSGRIAKNVWAKDSGGWYWMNGSGRIAKNAWAKDSKGWCWMGSNGRITKSKWIKYRNDWYYLNSSGYMVTGTQKINGKTYKFDKNGKWIS